MYSIAQSKKLSIDEQCSFCDRLQQQTKPVSSGCMSGLRDFVRCVRQNAQLSQLQLATKLGMTSDNYNKLETGKRGFSEKMLQKLAAIPELGVSYETLQAWKAIDEYGPEVIQQAATYLKERLPSEAFAMGLERTLEMAEKVKNERDKPNGQ